MPRPPSKHGLEKKFKSWRKGKGQNQYDAMGEKKVSGSSLKNRLRSQRRLLSKLGDSPDNSSSREKIDASIKALENQIADRESTEREKKNANKYHQIKFFERQKLTRLERKANKKLIEAKAAADFDDIKKIEAQLERIVLDQLYVAFYPNHTKYISLFAENSKGGNDVLYHGDEKTHQKQIVIRQKLLERIQQQGDTFIQENLKKKSWVNLKFLVKRGILDKKYNFEEALQNGSDIYKTQGDAVNRQKDVARKRELQKQMDKEIKQRNEKLLSIEEDDGDNVKIMKDRKGKNLHNDDSDSDDRSQSSESVSDDDSVDKQREGLNRPKPVTKVVSEETKSEDKNDSSSSSDSDSDSDSSSSSDSDSDSSDSSSDSDSDDSNNSKETGKTNLSNPAKVSSAKDEEESDDDFLVANNDEKPENVFAKAYKRREEEHSIGKKGDKSKGWTTQKQRPGEWKKKRQR